MEERRRILRGYRVLVLALVCCAGCSIGERPVYPVSGKVIFSDGDHAMFGDIEFRSESEPPFNARGKIQRDGTFEIISHSGRNGTVEGWHQVIIIQVVGNPLYGEVVHNHGRLVARKYASYDTTDLQVEVSASEENTVVLTVEPMEE